MEGAEKRIMWNPLQKLPEEKRRDARRGIAAVLLFLAATGALMLLIGKPLLQFIDDPDRFRSWVDAHGFWGRAAFVGMVMLQVVLALLPV